MQAAQHNVCRFEFMNSPLYMLPLCTSPLPGVVFVFDEFFLLKKAVANNVLDP